MATSAELIKARDNGAQILHNDTPVEYSPRYKGDRSPWAYRENTTVYRYMARECVAVYPAPVETPAPKPTPRALVAPEPCTGTCCEHTLPACICTVRTDYHDDACRAFQTAALAPDNKENDMASETTTRTGPLTDLQKSIMTGLMQGKTNYEVGEDHGKGRTHTANIIAAAVAKMGCDTSRQAIAMLATHNAYLEAAALIEADAKGLRSNNNASDDYVAAFLADLAKVLRSRAAKLLPS
jgi:hypothetical protein